MKLLYYNNKLKMPNSITLPPRPNATRFPHVHGMALDPAGQPLNPQRPLWLPPPLLPLP